MAALSDGAPFYLEVGVYPTYRKFIKLSDFEAVSADKDKLRMMFRIYAQVMVEYEK